MQTKVHGEKPAGVRAVLTLGISTLNSRPFPNSFPPSFPPPFSPPLPLSFLFFISSFFVAGDGTQEHLELLGCASMLGRGSTTELHVHSSPQCTLWYTEKSRSREPEAHTQDHRARV